MHAALKHQLSFRKPVPIALLIQRTGRPLITSLLGAKTPSQHARGLMCRKLPQATGLLFFMPRRMRFSLHMFFVFSSIDVLFCDSTAAGFKVIEKKARFKPWTLYTAKHQADCFLELHVDTAKNVRPGDLLVPKDF